ncbi:hypothetical protein AMTRI_Chr03g144710 [Amborella trichopoda]
MDLLRGLEFNSCVAPLCGFEGLSFLPRTWSKCAFGQTVTSVEFFRSKRFLTGGFPSLLSSQSLPLLIALSGHALLENHHHGSPNAFFF